MPFIYTTRRAGRDARPPQRTSTSNRQGIVVTQPRKSPRNRRISAPGFASGPRPTASASRPRPDIRPTATRTTTSSSTSSASGWAGTGRRLSRLRNADMADHFAGRKTFYFTADGRSAAPEVLINIDIDCHGSGTPGRGDCLRRAPEGHPVPQPVLRDEHQRQRRPRLHRRREGRPGRRGPQRGSDCPGPLAQGRVVPGSLGRRERRGQGPGPRVHLGQARSSNCKTYKAANSPNCHGRR